MKTSTKKLSPALIKENQTESLVAVWLAVFATAIFSGLYLSAAWVPAVIVSIGVVATAVINLRARQMTLACLEDEQYSHASQCVWKLDREA